MKCRLYDLGAIPGSLIEQIMVAPLGGSGCYKICGATIALREEIAATINVSQIKNL